MPDLSTVYHIKHNNSCIKNYAFVGPESIFSLSDSIKEDLIYGPSISGGDASDHQLYINPQKPCFTRQNKLYNIYKNNTLKKLGMG
jgi:hypothetical protein